MEVQPDFRELLALLNAHNVEYVVVGAYALAFHGAPRFTGDLDVFVQPSAENAARILAALAAFGFRFENLTAQDFTVPNQVVQLGLPPVRIDLITSITGVSWEQARSHRVAGNFGNVPVHYLGLDEYIANKRATARKKDIADLEELGQE